MNGLPFAEIENGEGGTSLGESEFRACRVGSTYGTSKWRRPVDGLMLGSETQEKLYC